MQLNLNITLKGGCLVAKWHPGRSGLLKYITTQLFHNIMYVYTPMSISFLCACVIHCRLTYPNANMSAAVVGDKLHLSCEPVVCGS